MSQSRLMCLFYFKARDALDICFKFNILINFQLDLSIYFFTVSYATFPFFKYHTAEKKMGWY